MRVQVAGFEGPVAHATRAELHRRGHQVVESNADSAIFLPGSTEELSRLASDPNIQRLVLRSHAFVYGSNPKNPGYMTESRGSLLHPKSEANKWLRMEELAANHPNSAFVRLTNVADA